MTAIEYENYLTERGVDHKTANAIATGVEKVVADRAPVTKDYLDVKLQELKFNIYKAGLLALLPVYAKLYNII